MGQFSSPAAASIAITPALLNADTDNWAPAGIAGASRIRAECSLAAALSGIVGGVDGRQLIIYNVGAFALTLVHDALSIAANRFFLASAANKVLQPGGACVLSYDGTSARWRGITFAA